MTTERRFMPSTIQTIDSSYRDPSGFMFTSDGVLYRQVNKIFKENFDHFINSGCYDHLVKNKWLIPHIELSENLTASGEWYKTLRPEKLNFISYDYEWSFDMLKDAALLTLQLVKECMPFGVMLKDAAPSNIQWKEGRPVFIDTISFEKYDSSKPWIAYRQFCENFLSPLLLMHYRSQPLQTLLLAYPDGIPLAIAKSLLPRKSFFSFYTYLHIHLHSKWSLKKIENTPVSQPMFSEKKFSRVIESLQSLVSSLKWKDKPTTWNNYYQEASQRQDYVERKKELVNSWLNGLSQIKTAADIGANTGEFSRLPAQKNIETIATDLDHSAINKLYQKIKQDGEKNILPLVIDIANPSPAGGLNNKERPSFLERTKVDLTFALALIHHLAIGRNIPFDKIATLFASMTKYLIIEFVPKGDEKVKLMLQQKKDIYSNYEKEEFEKIFRNYFDIVNEEPVGTSGRTLYLMTRHER
jgi:hypothetical protein